MATDQPTPAHTHDCTECVYLGQCIGGGKLVDLYYHANPRHVTLIARYGDEASEYLSIDEDYVTPTGHAELWAAATLFRARQEQGEETINTDDIPEVDEDWFKKANLRCPRALSSPRVPCWVRDGKLAVSDDGWCVGCNFDVATFEERRER